MSDPAAERLAAADRELEQLGREPDDVDSLRAAYAPAGGDLGEVDAALDALASDRETLERLVEQGLAQLGDGPRPEPPPEQPTPAHAEPPSGEDAPGKPPLPGESTLSEVELFGDAELGSPEPEPEGEPDFGFETTAMPDPSQDADLQDALAELLEGDGEQQAEPAGLADQLEADIPATGELADDELTMSHDHIPTAEHDGRIGADALAEPDSFTEIDSQEFEIVTEEMESPGPAPAGEHYSQEAETALVHTPPADAAADGGDGGDQDDEPTQDDKQRKGFFKKIFG